MKQFILLTFLGAFAWDCILVIVKLIDLKQEERSDYMNGQLTRILRWAAAGVLAILYSNI